MGYLLMATPAPCSRRSSTAQSFIKVWKETEKASDIDLRWGMENAQIIFTTQDNHDGVITHLEPDILECKVRWVLGSITTNKASRGDGIPVELFQILKDNTVKVLHSICQQIWKTQQWPQDWKRSVFIPVPKKGQRMLKLLHNCTHLTR